MTGFENTAIETLLFTTLTNNATLMGLLAPGNLPPGYQQSVYAHIVPEVDPISKQQPRPPYILFTQVGMSQPDIYGMALNRVLSVPSYRVTVWDTNTGGASTASVQTIMQQVGLLLDGLIATTSNPNIGIRRENTDTIIDNADGGKVYVGVTSTYKIFCH